MDDVDHPLDLLGSDGPRPRLLPEKIHNMSRKLLTTLERKVRLANDMVLPGRISLTLRGIYS